MQVPFAQLFDRQRFSPKSRAALGRLLLIEIAALAVALGLIQKAHHSHWYETRYGSQTLELNLLAHTLPPTLSLALLRQDSQALQEILDSNEGQFGLVLTDVQGKKILALSRPPRWGNQKWRQQIERQGLAAYPYDFLFDPPSLSPQGLYPHAKSPQRIVQPAQNSGKILGRIYYVRNLAPGLLEDLGAWLRQPGAINGRFELYTLILLASLWGGAATWTSVEYLRAKRQLWRQEQEKLHQALGQSQKIHLHLQQEAEQLRQNLAERNTQNTLLIHQLETTRSELQQSQHQQQSQITTLRQAIAAYEDQLSSLQQSADGDRHLAQLQNQLLEAQERQTRTEARVQTLSQQIQQLRQQRQQAEQKVQELSQQLRQVPIAELESLVEQARQESALQRGYADYALEENERLQKDLRELLRQNEDLYQKNEGLKEQTQHLCQQLQDYKDQIEELRPESVDDWEEEKHNAHLRTSMLTNISSRAAIQALERFGFSPVRQTGSHVILKKTAQFEISVSVPMKGELKPPTLKQILRQAQISGEDFLDKL
jgi:predicted RNA binding protein YcfA (HicA-like mRNA interferase family)